MDEPRDFVKEAAQWLKTPEPLEVLLERERPKAISWLETVLRQPGEGGAIYARKYAAFVLGQVGAVQSLEALEQARQVEGVRGVQEAIDAALVALRQSGLSTTTLERRRMIENVYDGKPATWTPPAASPPSAPGEPKKAGGCWIATAAYGPTSPEVVFLQSFRDARLSPNPLGRLLVRGYYATAPILARLMIASPAFSAVVRSWILKPILRHLGFTVDSCPSHRRGGAHGQ